MLSFAIKYPENRKKQPINPDITDVPMMKFGTNALKQAVNEFDIRITIHTINPK